MSKTKYDFILSLFVSDNRHPLMKPHTGTDMTYATDSYHAVMLPKTLTGEYGVEGDAFPIDALRQIFLDVRGMNSFFRMQVGDIFAALAEFRVMHEKDTCDKCDGEGSIGCEYCRRVGRCEDCDGKGVGANKRVPKIMIIEDEFIIEGIKINPQFLFDIAMAASICGEREITFQHNDEKMRLYAKFGEVETIIMAKR